MNRLARAARRPAAAGALCALLVAVFNWPLLGAPLSLSPGPRILLLFAVWLAAVAALAVHARLAGRDPDPSPEDLDA